MCRVAAQIYACEAPDATAAPSAAPTAPPVAAALADDDDGVADELTSSAAAVACDFADGLCAGWATGADDVGGTDPWIAKTVM